LTTPTHTATARAILGKKFLAPEAKVFLGQDSEEARRHGRHAVGENSLRLRNYVKSLELQGFTESDFANNGSDSLIDSLVAYGDAAGIAEQLHRHLDAGADHVAIQVVPTTRDPLPALRALAPALNSSQAHIASERYE